MDIKKLYNEWLENAVEDKDLTAELESIKNNEDEIYDRFYTALKFGTAGLRGIIGAGTNRKIGRASCREKCRSRWSPYH